MNLFFETANQAQVFLAAVPIGFLLALCFDVISRAGPMRPVLDVLCLLLAGLALIALMLALKDSGLRLYHLLALATGATLYLAGVGRLYRILRRRAAANRKSKAKAKKHQKDAGNPEAASNT